MAKPALIIFDVDGTLLQSQRITIPAIRETLTAYGVSPPNDDAIRATFGIPVQEYEAWLEGWCPPERAAELVDATNERELELISQGGALFPGVVEMLEALKDVGHALATCTNASVAYLDRVLDTYELHRFFQMSVCIGHGFPSKTAMVGHIINAISLRPAVVVGDRLGDIDAAKANRAYAIAADYGYSSPAELEGADAHARMASEIPLIVERVIADAR